jgi:hypothetical protein
MAAAHRCCPECDAWFVDGAALDEHVTFVHRHACLLRPRGCMREFSSAQDMSAHMSAEHFQCDVCGEWFFSALDCESHRAGHWLCPFCSHEFATQRDMRQHVFARVNGVCYRTPATHPPGSLGHNATALLSQRLAAATTRDLSGTSRGAPAAALSATGAAATGALSALAATKAAAAASPSARAAATNARTQARLSQTAARTARGLRQFSDATLRRSGRFV